MDLQLLRAFLAVAELGSVSAAAEDIGYSQPGLSQLLLPYARMTVMMLRDVNRAIADFQAAQDTARQAKPLTDQGTT